MRSKRVITISRLSMFLAVGIILNIFESMLPVLVPIQGVKLGLANTIGLLVLYFYSPKEYVGIGFLRVLIVGLLRGSIITFAISFSGWLLSTIIVLIFYAFKKASIYGLSIISAVGHSVGQILMVMIYYKMPLMINYLPILLFTSIISGALIAYLSSIVLKHLEVVFK